VPAPVDPPRQPRPERYALVVEDSASLRALISGAVASLGFVVEAVADARAALRAFPGLDPDVLIADIDLGSRPNGVELAHILRAQAPYIGVVFLTHYPTPESAAHGMSLPEGSAFVNKSSLTDLADLVQAIESALSDDVDAVRLVAAEDVNPLVSLTAGQLAVLADLAAGYTNAEIAERRGSSLRATERMIVRTFDALGLSDDASHNPRVMAAMMYARHAGLPVEARS
jgi:DNA-binding NarL/FixJ family response regulator